MSLRKKTIYGLKWNFLNQFGIQFLNLAFSILLARILGPEAFGLIAMVTVFTGVSTVLMDFGFGNALIYKRDSSKEAWSTVFWFNAILGIALFLIIQLSASSIADFYNEEDLELITRLISFTVLLSSLSISFQARLRKSMDFKSVSKASLISIILSGAIGVILAYKGYGVWSLVYQRVLNSFLKFFLLFVLGRWLPSMIFSTGEIKKIFNYSIYLFMGKILSYGSRNLDNLLIGKFINSHELGLYSRAYSFLMLPVKLISQSVNMVMFPAYSKLKDEDRIRSQFMLSSQLISLIVTPLMLVLLICAKEFTLILFGPKWIEMVPFLQAFSILGIYQTILALNGPLYMARGKTKLDFRVGIFTQSVNLMAISVGIYWGVQGVIFAIFVALIINFWPVNKFILEDIGLTIWKYYKRLIPIFAMNFGVFLLVYIMKAQVQFELWPSLISNAIAFAILYLICIRIFYFSKVKHAISLISKGKTNEEVN